MHKKAEMGVGTLIIFIAMLLVAAVAAGVLLQTAGALQEKSLSTGSQAKAQISTNARVIEVSATDGRNATLTDFQEIIKLSPGSDPIKLDQIIFTFNTKDKSSTLKYKGTSGLCEKGNALGYNTWIIENILTDVTNTTGSYTLAEDLDDDGADDSIYVYNDGTPADDYLYISLSSLSVPLNVSLGADIDNVGVGKALSISNALITDATTDYAYITLSQTTNTNGTIDAGNGFSITPFREGEGYFTATYEQTGTNHVAGNMQRGDIIRLCFESPGAIIEDEEVRLNFIPKVGTATLTTFATPDVISTERIYLYP